MPEINPDETMADETNEATSDAALGDETPSPEPEPDPEPEGFDLKAWLEGIGPAIAEYPLAGGGRIPLRARTEDWRREWAESSKDSDADERDRRFVAAHIADDSITADALAGLQVHRPADWADLVALIIHLDTRPTNLLAPRFLPGASA